MERESIILSRDTESIVIPDGNKITLQKGSVLSLLQTLGGNFSVLLENGGMARIEGKDADALGKEVPQEARTDKPKDPNISLEKEVWDELRTCYDPEIPVNIVDLGLIYVCNVYPIEDKSTKRVEIKMTLTAPGCGMGQVLCDDVKQKVQQLARVEEVDVELVLDPAWSQDRMSEAARLQLGLL